MPGPESLTTPVRDRDEFGRIAKIERAVALNAYGRKLGVAMPLFAQNLFGEQAVFLLSRKA